MLGLTVTAGPLQLRCVSDDDLPALCALAVDGIHPPEQMPFAYPWTDAPPDELARNTVQYFWRLRAEFTAASWSLQFGVWLDGEFVGIQGLEATNYLVTRTGETGSWLGRRYQGRGIGTAMRQAICAFAFDHLDAAEITSGAFLDNPASLAVSRKVGYRPDGVIRMQRRPGELIRNQRLVLTPGELVRGPHPLQVCGLTALRAQLGLDPAPTPEPDPHHR